MLFKQVEGQYVALGAATSHTLNATREEMDVSNKDTGEWGDIELGQCTWDIQADCMMIETDYDSLMDSFLATETLHVAFAVSAEAGAKTGKPEEGWTIGTGGYEGDVCITSINASAAHNDKATYSVTFKGKGPLTKRTNA
jgi:predicted secreted protein